LRIGKRPYIVKVDAGETGMTPSITEEIRLRYLYRRLILQGKLTISLRSALGLVGPDCAFHLYSMNYSHSKREQRKKP
jgi:hypothetical protein